MVRTVKAGKPKVANLEGFPDTSQNRLFFVVFVPIEIDGSLEHSGFVAVLGKASKIHAQSVPYFRSAYGMETYV